MTPDPKLVEAVARAILAGHDWTVGAHIDEDETRDENTGWEAMQPDWQEAYRKMARAALAAIPASGEWWIAPTKPTGAMIAGGNAAGFKSSWLTVTSDVYAGMRDAHLKDTGTVE